MKMEIRFPGNARVDATFGPHTVRTDQPAPVGDGSAPTPFATFLASLGTCAGIYVLGFCRQRGLPTEGIRLVQEVEVDRATGRLAQVRIGIHVPPTFPEKYRAALIRSAEQCAVKQVLESPPAFAVETVVDEVAPAA